VGGGATYEAGIEDYKVLATRGLAMGTVAGTAYGFGGGQWWGFDTPATVASKMTYKKNQSLGGTFFWELSGDTTSGTMISAIANND
jgi:chitinase